MDPLFGTPATYSAGVLLIDAGQTLRREGAVQVAFRQE